MTNQAESLYTLLCGQTGETQQVAVCAGHSAKMPACDGELVTVERIDEDGIECEFCRPENQEV